MMDRKQQGRLNFTRGNKIYILREMTRLVPHYRMIRVLRAIDERHWQFARDEDSVTLTHQDIASCDGMSVPTARRGIDDLIQCGLLIKNEIVTSYGQAANSYKIAWSNLDAIVNDGEPLTYPAPVSELSTADISETPAPDLDYESSQVVKVAGDHSDHPPDHEDDPELTQVVKVGGDHIDHPPDHGDQASLYPLININPPPPDSNNPTWEEVELILISEFEMGRPSKAIEAARERGCGPGDIMRLINYARSKPGAYQAGAIYNRISEDLPGRDPTSGWARESDAFLKRSKQIKSQAKRSQAAEKAAEREAKRAKDQQARQELEREFGPELDQMNHDELLDFASENSYAVVVQALVKDPNAHQSNFYRPVFLSALQRQATGMPGNSKSVIAEGPAIADRR